MNKLSATLLLIACAYAVVTIAHDDSVFDTFTEEEFVQSPASDLKKANAAAAAAQAAENAKSKALHKSLKNKIVSHKSTVHAAVKSLGNSAVAAFQGAVVKTMTALAKRQARKNKNLRRKQNQAKNSAVRANARNHMNMVKAQGRMVKALSRVAASQRKMLAQKKKAAKFFNDQIAAAKAGGKAADKVSMARLGAYNQRMKHIGNKIKSNKKLAKRIQRKWANQKAKSAAKGRAIDRKYKARQAKLAVQNASNLRNFNIAIAKGQAKFAARARSNQLKAALANARIKTQAAVNAMNEKHTKKRAARLHAKESGLKASAKRKELGAKAAANKKLNESRQKEKVHKAKVSNEADTKYKRRAAHAAAMKKDADAAKAAAAASVAASERSTKAQKKADAAQDHYDANIKECDAMAECLMADGHTCMKTGAASGWYQDQVGFVKCVRKKPQNMMGDWAGSPFKESDFPEAVYKEPKFEMPVMPGFKNWHISDHFDKVKASITAGIKKAAKNDSKEEELDSVESRRRGRRHRGRRRAGGSLATSGSFTHMASTGNQ